MTEVPKIVTKIKEVDLFIRIAPKDRIRFGITMACLARWKSDSLVRIRPIVPSTVKLYSPSAGQFASHFDVWNDLDITYETIVPWENFHFASRQYADENATTDPYIMVDDDEMPLGKDWVEHALNLWHLYNGDKKYVMMVGRPALRAEDYTQHHERLRTSKLEVEEMPYWWGCPYLSYKGAVPYGEFKGRPEQQDPMVEEWAKRNGKKQALMMGVYYNHFGMSFSQVQPALYGRF